MFGIKHQSGIRFGIQVPAPFVYVETGQSLVDVYPRQEKNNPDVTIFGYLITLAEESGVNMVHQVIRTGRTLRRMKPIMEEWF